MSNCPVENALKLIGGKWKIPIIHHLSKKLRFGQIKKVLNQITQQMLSKQLKEMEADGLIIRKVYSVVPPKVEYSLTDFGKSVLPILTFIHGLLKIKLFLKLFQRTIRMQHNLSD